MVTPSQLIWLIECFHIVAFFKVKKLLYVQILLMFYSSILMYVIDASVKHFIKKVCQTIQLTGIVSKNIKIWVTTVCDSFYGGEVRQSIIKEKNLR